MSEWTCPKCGSEDPHHAMIVNGELEVDVTCGSVYFTPIDESTTHGLAFGHKEFEDIIEHYKSADNHE